MSIGNVNKEEFTGPKYPLAGILKHQEWEQKRKYEENVVLVDIRCIDQDGTLEVVKTTDRALCKSYPQVTIVDGFLVINVRRER